jgi:hypothetical protein
MNNTQLFALLFNHSRPDVNLAAFARYLEESVFVSQLLHHAAIPNLTFVRSPLTSFELTARLEPFLTKDFLVVPVDITKTDGRLTSAAWDVLWEKIPMSLTPGTTLEQAHTAKQVLYNPKPTEK